MASRQGKEGSVLVNRSDYLPRFLISESESLNQSLLLIEEISKKHNINFDQIAELLKNKDRYASVPIGLFRSDLGPLESIVRYLKEMQGYTFSHISKVLCRDETTIWTSYNNSMKKSTIIIDLDMKEVDFKALRLKKEDLIVPLSIFSERKLSILESLCLYLYTNFKLNYHTIGQLLERDERTIWTVVNRARKKLHNG